MSSIEKAMARLRLKRNRSEVKAKKLISHGLDIDVAPEKSHKKCIINEEFLKKNNLSVPRASNKQFAEEFRIIKRPLLMNIAGKGAHKPENANLIMVMSALPGEGKTFTMVNLALSIANEKNKTVMLIDSDVVKPSLSEMLGLADEPGFIDLLQHDNVNVSDVIVKTNIPNLSVIPAGRINAQATELLASEQAKELAAELAARYSDRIIIFDTPPLLLTTESKILIHLAGQIVFVTEAGKTLQHDIMEAVSQIDKNKVAGLVINKTRHAFGREHYGSYGSNPYQANASPTGE